METIFADFNNLDSWGRVRLITTGSLESIQPDSIELIEGKQVQLDDEDGLRNIGTLYFSKDENIWVAKLSPDNYIEY